MTGQQEIKLHYDKAANAAYITIIEGEPVKKTYSCDPVEVGGIINIDFNEKGKVVGIELLDATQYLPATLLKQVL